MPLLLGAGGRDATENGYLSIRLKPSSTLFPIVKDIYSQLLKLEKSIETEAKRRPEAMAASAELLSLLLKSHGFRDYTTYSCTPRYPWK